MNATDSGSLLTTCQAYLFISGSTVDDNIWDPKLRKYSRGSVLAHATLIYHCGSRIGGYGIGRARGQAGVAGMKQRYGVL